MIKQKTGKTKRSPWSILEKYPPVLVRLLARTWESSDPDRGGSSHGSVRALSNEEVALDSGLPPNIIEEISQLTTWDTVPVAMVRMFCRGCHFAPVNYWERNRTSAYPRTNPKFVYLKKSPHWVEVFLPLIRILEGAKDS